MSDDDPFELLAAALGAVPGPPLDQLGEAAVWEWLEHVRAGLVSRRDSRRIAAAVEAVLWDNYLTAEHVRRTVAKAERHEAIKAAREAGRYWADLDSRRKARRPTHVEVDPVAWTILRQRAVLQAVTIGELVGHLVTREAGQLELGQHRPPASSRRGRPGDGRRAGLFARLAVTDDAWSTFRSGAIGAGLTVARYVGMVAEEGAARAGWPALGR